jgi:hypothetical protein
MIFNVCGAKGVVKCGKTTTVDQSYDQDLFTLPYVRLLFYVVMCPCSLPLTGLKENDSSESHPVKYYLSKSLKVFGFKYT